MKTSSTGAVNFGEQAIIGWGPPLRCCTLHRPLATGTALGARAEKTRSSSTEGKMYGKVKKTGRKPLAIEIVLWEPMHKRSKQQHNSCEY